MFNIIRYILIGLLCIATTYLGFVAIVKPIRLSNSLVLTKEAAKLRAILFSLSATLGAMAVEIFLPNLICILFLAFLLMFFWLEYIILKPPPS